MTDDIQAAVARMRGEVQARKETALQDIMASRPSSIERAPVPSRGSHTLFVGGSADIPEPDNTQPGVFENPDGSFRYIDPYGGVSPNLTQEEAVRMQAYDRENLRARQAGAGRVGTVGNDINAIGQSVVDIAGTMAKSTTGDTTLSNNVRLNNDQFAPESAAAVKEIEESGNTLALMYALGGGGQASGRSDVEISARDEAAYKSIQESPELAGEFPEFVNSPEFARLQELNKRAIRNQDSYDDIQEVQDKVNSHIPVNRADSAAAHAAYKLIAENEGNWTAITNALNKDLGTFLRQGVHSVPYMVAFTIGGPATQTAILTSLAVGAGREAVQEFKQREGREPTADEVQRIEAWAAVATVAEKFGDMAAVKAIPISRLRWAQQVQNHVRKSTPANIVNLLAVRPVAALAGEGLSGGITAASEQMAQSGEITDTDEIAFQALTEALATPGGLGAMTAANVSRKVAVGTAKSVAGQVRNRGNDSAPVAEETPREPMADNAFNQFIQIMEGENVSQAAAASREILDKYELTDEQAARFDTAQDVLLERSRVATEERTILGNIGDWDAVSKEDLEAIRNDEASTAADKAHAEEAIKNKEIEETLAARDGKNAEQVAKDTEEVRNDVRFGEDGQWTGFRSYLELIKEAIVDDSLDDTQRGQRVLRLQQDMETFLSNMNKKLAMFEEAATKTPDNTDSIVAVVGKRVNPNSETDRSMTYEVVTNYPKADYAKTRGSGYVTQIHNGSGKLIQNVRDDVAYGESTLKLVKSHKETTFAKNQQESTARQEQLNKDIEELTGKDISLAEVAALEDADIDALDAVRVEAAPADATPSLAEDTEQSLIKKISDLQIDLAESAPGSPEFTEATTRLGEANAKLAEIQSQNAASEADSTESSSSDNAATEPQQQEAAPDTETEATAPAEDTVAAPEGSESISDSSTETEASQAEDTTAEEAPVETAAPEQSSNTEDSQPKARTYKASDGQSYKVVFLPKGHASLNGRIAFYSTKKNRIFMQEGITKKEFLDYIEGGLTNSDSSTQKKVVAQYMLDKFGVDMNAIFGEITDENTIRKFILEHEVSHQRNNHAATYRSDTKQTLAGDLANPDNTLLSDSAILAEAQANMEAMQALNLLPETAAEAPQATETPETGSAPEEEVEVAPGPFTESKSISLPEMGKGIYAVISEVAGKAFKDLVKVSSDSVIGTLPDSAFKSVTALSAALEEAGLGKESADYLAKTYRGYSARINSILLDEEAAGKFGKDGIPGLRKPMAMLFDTEKRTIPHQVKLALLVAAMGWVKQNPNNKVFNSNYDRERFLYGTQGAEIDASDLAQLDGLGHSFQYAVESIGANVRSILGLSPVDSKNDLFSENLITALGISALEGMDNPSGFLTIEKKTWEFKEKEKEGRNFRSGDSYNHILINNIKRTLAKRGDSFTEIQKILNPRGNYDTHLPLQEAPTEVDRQIRGSMGGIPQKVRKVLRKIQNVEWSKAKQLELFTGLAENYRDVLELLAEVVEINPEWNDTYIKALEASNGDKQNAIDMLLEADSEGALDKFYFKYSLQNQHRIMMLGRFNPQNSHVIRHLVKPFKTQTYKSKRSIQYFKLAVMANLGFPVDKSKPSEIRAAYNEMIASPEIAQAIEAVQKKNMAGLAKVLPKLKAKYGGDISILSAVQALADSAEFFAGNADSFKSDIAMEIDGVTNGFAITLLQFPVGPWETVVRRLNQVGIYLGKTKDATTHLISGIYGTGEYTDVYMDLGELIAKYSDYSSFITSATDRGDSAAQKIGEEEYTAASDALARISEVFGYESKKALRELAKNPFTVFQYGGGIRSISESIGKTAVKDMYRKISEYRAEYVGIEKSFRAEIGKTNGEKLSNTELVQLSKLQTVFRTDSSAASSFGSFVRDLQELGVSPSSNVDVLARQVLKKKYELPERDVINTVRLLVHPRLEQALDDIQGDSKNLREAAVLAGETMHAIFRVELDKAIAAKKAELRKQGVKRDLTNREEAEIVREQLIHLLPQYKGPLMQQSNQRVFVDLSRMTRDYSNDSNDNTSVEVMRNSEKHGGAARRTASNSKRTYVSPGVSALIRMIINMDSTLMTESLDQYPEMLTLYDAFMGPAEQLSAVSKIYGKKFLEHGMSTSIMESIAAQLDESIAASSPETLKAATQWLKNNAFGDREEATIEYNQQLVRIAAETTAEERVRLRNAIEEQGAVAHQLYIPEYGEDTDTDTIEPAGAADVTKVEVGQALALRKTEVIREKIGKFTQDMLLHAAMAKALLELSPDRFVAMLSEVTPDNIAQMVDIVLSDRAKKNSALLHKTIRKTFDVSNEKADEIMASFIVGENNESFVADLTEALGEKKAAQLRKKVLEEMGSYDLGIEFSESPTLEADNEIIADVKDELRSINAPRSNVDHLMTGKLTKENIGKLFDRLTNFSQHYYPDSASRKAHTDSLRSVLQVLSKGLDGAKGIRITLEQIDGITQGSYNAMREIVRVSLSRQVPQARNGQSAAETYVHELVHALTLHAMRNEPLVAQHLRRLYDDVHEAIKKDGAYRVFLRGINNPTEADIDAAKQQYGYLFRRFKESEDVVLAEFLAYAATNPALSEYMKQRTSTRRTSDNKLWDMVLAAMDYVVDMFNRIILKKVENNQYEEVIGILETLVEIQADHGGRLRTYSDKVDDRLSKFDQAIKKRALHHVSKLTQTDNPGIVRKVAAATIGGATVYLSSNAQVAKAMRTVYRPINQTVADLAHELGDGVLSEPMIRQLLDVTNKISRARQSTERDFASWFQDIWVNNDPAEFTRAEREALTDVFLRADLSSLLVVDMTPQQITNMLTDREEITLQQHQLIKQLKLKRRSDAVAYAEDLGRHIVLHTNEVRYGHTNAHTIVHDLFTSAEMRANPHAAEILDAIATLEALKTIDTNVVELASKIAQNEFEGNAEENGVYDILSYHLEFIRASRQELFNDNPMQMYKGWVVERVDNLHDIQIGEAGKLKEMRKRGYKDTYSLGKIPGIKQESMMFVSRHRPQVPFISGIMSVTNRRNIGTTLSELLAREEAYKNPDGTVDWAKVNRDIRKRIAREKRAAATGVRRSAPGETTLRPLRNDRGDVVDFRVIMANANKREILDPDLEFQNVFAHMQSSLIDKMNTIISDKKTVDIMVHEMVHEYPKNKKDYINILDPDEKYHESYRRLPKEVQMYMKQYAVNDQFMVRRDAVTKIFGFQAIDPTNMEIFQRRGWARADFLTRMGIYGLKSLMKFAVDRIVIGMSAVVLRNIISNNFNLMMRGVPPLYIMRKMREGIVEYNRYEKDLDRSRSLLYNIRAKNLPESHPDSLEYFRLKSRIENNKIHRLNEAGVNSLIVEDLNETSQGGYVRRGLRALKASRMEKYIDATPDALLAVPQWLFMTNRSLPYRQSKHVVQLSDFMARYVMIEHAVERKGQSFDQALPEAIEAFVLFDENITPAAEFINSVGGTMFTTYALRNIRSAKRLIVDYPSRVMISGAVQQLSEIDTMANINGTPFTADWPLAVLQVDDAAGIVITPPLLNNIDEMLEVF